MLSYTICREARIRRIEGDWDGFAERNQAAELTASSVVDTLLWDHVTGMPMRQLLSDLFRRARTLGHRVTVPFRCDAGPARRYMRMHVEPLPDEALRIVSETIREVARTPVPLLDRDRPRAGDLLNVCSWCKRLRVSGEWLEIEDAVTRLHLFDEPLPPPITHGICNECLATTLGDLAAGPQLVPPG